jgi:hypothetical protein
LKQENDAWISKTYWLVCTQKEIVLIEPSQPLRLWTEPAFPVFGVVVPLPKPPNLPPNGVAVAG